MNPGPGQSWRLRVPLVGTREFGHDHVRVCHALESTELAGIYDQNSKCTK